MQIRKHIFCHSPIFPDSILYHYSKGQVSTFGRPNKIKYLGSCVSAGILVVGSVIAIY